MQKLHKYQNTGKTFLKSKRFALLADEQGLGKTVQAISAVKSINKILIICPCTVKYVWAKEIDKWQPEPYQVVDGSGDKFLDKKYTIINYDLLIREPIFLQLMARNYGLIICDEAHYFKNFEAKRTKIMYYPKGLKDRTQRVWLLTGTPILNRPKEIFSHLKSLAPERLGRYKSYHLFTQKFCSGHFVKIWVKNKLGKAYLKNKWVDTGSSNGEELSKMLNGFMLRRMKKDVLKELPDKTFQTINFKPDTRSIKRAEKEREEYGKEKEGMLGELATLRRESGMAKIDLSASHIMDLLETEEKIVIFAYHKDVIAGLKSALAQFSPAVITGATPSKKRQLQIDKFRTEKTCRLFIGNIQAAGMGIDGLQDVCSTVVFAEMSWVPGQIHQAVDRCHRIGQKDPVLVQFLVVTGSIDEDIADSIAIKEKSINKIIKATQTEEEVMSPRTNKKFAVTVTVEVEAVTLADSVAIVSNGMKAKDANITIIHKATQSLVQPSLQQMVAQALPEKTEEKPVVEAEPVKKKRAPRTKKVEAPNAVVAKIPEGGGIGVYMTGIELMKYCNGVLSAIKVPSERTAKVKEVSKMFKETFSITAVKDIPLDKIAEAKEAFDALTVAV